MIIVIIIIIIIIIIIMVYSIDSTRWLFSYWKLSTNLQLVCTFNYNKGSCSRPFLACFITEQSTVLAFLFVIKNVFKKRLEKKYIYNLQMLCNFLMYQSNLSFKIPPGNPPSIWNFEDWLVQIPSPRGKKNRSNAPPNSTEIPLLKDKLRFNQTLFKLFREWSCRNDTFTPFFKTLWKELFTNRGEIYLVNPSNPAKTEKTYGRITLEQEINTVQIPHPSNATFKFPSPRARCTVKCPGCARGGMLKFDLTGT